MTTKEINDDDYFAFSEKLQFFIPTEIRPRLFQQLSTHTCKKEDQFSVFPIFPLYMYFLLCKKDRLQFLDGIESIKALEAQIRAILFVVPLTALFD